MSDLDKLKTLEGYLASSLVDSTSGMVLEVHTEGEFEIEAASAANTDVVQAKLRAMRDIGLEGDYIEDILISLGSQYHLIRPLAVRPEIFLYLALDRATANLAKARLTLRQVEENVQI